MIYTSQLVKSLLKPMMNQGIEDALLGLAVKEKVIIEKLSQHGPHFYSFTPP